MKDFRMFNKISLAALILAVGLSASLTAEADSKFYRWVDKDGAIHYSPTKPYGVKSEIVDTTFSNKQIELIKKSNREKQELYNIQNQDKLAQQKELERKNYMDRMQTCVDITFDKMSYQKRHIDDNSIKQKLDCEYKYNRNKQSAKYDQCILEVESDRLNKMKILEQSANHCFNDETDPEVIDAVMKKYREAPNIKASTGDLMQEDQDIKDVPQMVAPKKNTKDADKKTAPQKKK